MENILAMIETGKLILKQNIKTMKRMEKKLAIILMVKLNMKQNSKMGN